MNLNEIENHYYFHNKQSLMYFVNPKKILALRDEKKTMRDDYLGGRSSLQG